MRCAAAMSALLAFEQREVEVGDRLFDQPAVILVVEDLAGHLRRRDEREVGDLGTDLPERSLRLGLDLPPSLLEPALPVDLDLVLRALALRVGDAARVGQDLLGLALGLPDQAAVLLKQSPRLGP